MNTKIKVVIGCDISTNVPAFCVLNAKTHEHIKTYHSILNNPKKFPTFWAKIKHMKSVFDIEHDPNWEVVKIGVEEPVKRFSIGFSSVDTIITLSRFNAILCYLLLEKYNIEPTYINVRTARKKLGIVVDKNSSTNKKKQVMEQVIKMNPNMPWIFRNVKGEEVLVKINEDRADAWVIAANL